MSDRNIKESEFEAGMTKMLEVIEGRFQALEERCDSLEHLHANLVLAYAELATAVETIVAEIMEPRDEDQRQAFREEIERRFHATLDMIQEVTREAAKHDSKDAIAKAMAKMAEAGPDISTDE